MPSPSEFMRQYKDLKVNAVIEDPIARMSREIPLRIELRKYFLMKWDPGTDHMNDYDLVTSGSKHNAWFRSNQERISTAAMGKGAPRDYELALEWAVRAKKIATINQATLQKYCDDHLGIDCSGFVTNYRAASGKCGYSSQTVRNTSAASYYNVAKAINDPGQIRQGDLLVWMHGNTVLTSPGHVALVESYLPQSMVGGNMRVVEATAASPACPSDSMYAVEGIIPKGGPAQVMILVVRRFGAHSRVSVMRH